jgi:hypothetical protein
MDYPYSILGDVYFIGHINLIRSQKIHRNVVLVVYAHKKDCVVAFTKILSSKLLITDVRKNLMKKGGYQ